MSFSSKKKSKLNRDSPSLNAFFPEKLGAYIPPSSNIN